MQQDEMSVKRPGSGVSLTSGVASVGCTMQSILAFPAVDARRTCGGLLRSYHWALCRKANLESAAERLT